MSISGRRSVSRRNFCLCCVGAGAYTATGGWLTPREAFAEARGLVSVFKDSAAITQITTHKLRDNISVLEGSGGNIAVLTGPDGKVLIDGGIGASRTQITKALADLGGDPITHMVNTHWHFDHTSSNEWLHAAGAKIIAQENTRKYLSEVQRVEDWDYNFLPLSPGGVPSEVFAAEHSLKLNGATIGLKRYTPAHTDSDISVIFGEADILHTGDTYWNGIYPFIDYSTGGSIDGRVVVHQRPRLGGEAARAWRARRSHRACLGRRAQRNREKSDRGVRRCGNRPRPRTPSIKDCYVLDVSCGSKRAVTWLSGFEVGPTLRHATMGAKCHWRARQKQRSTV